MRYTTKLLPSRSGGNLGVLTLNNAGSFHALTTDMIFVLQDILSEWYKDPSLHAILLKSSTHDPSSPKRRAFCAGGDVKQVYLSGMNKALGPHGIGFPGLETSEFFRHEYDVNYQMAIHKDKVPQVSVWDGIVMGGGVGISIHGKYRVATEHSVFSMPETAIGLFPDVGSMWWMPRLLSPSTAAYLALTGKQLYPADLLYAGLATHYVPSERLPELEETLAHVSKEEIAQVLLSFHENTTPDPLNSALAQDHGVIDRVFRVLADGTENQSVEAIVKNLAEHDTEFARSTLKVLQTMSPTSLKVTLEGLRRGSKLTSIKDDFVMEFRMSQGFMRSHDFYEGIRARLIEKDNKPKWKPATLEEVTPEMVESFFEPVDYEWEPISMKDL